jgi:hypothetical protein
VLCGVFAAESLLDLESHERAGTRMQTDADDGLVDCCTHHHCRGSSVFYGVCERGASSDFGDSSQRPCCGGLCSHVLLDVVRRWCPLQSLAVVATVLALGPSSHRHCITMGSCCAVDSWHCIGGSFREIFQMSDTRSNKSPEPTAVGAVSSAVAVRVASRRWLSFLR